MFTRDQVKHFVHIIVIQQIFVNALLQCYICVRLKTFPVCGNIFFIIQERGRGKRGRGGRKAGWGGVGGSKLIWFSVLEFPCV